MDLITPQTHSSPLPSEVLLQILSYLDLPSLCSCMQVSSSFYQIIDQQLWKILFFRDFSQFLYQMPLSDEDLGLPQDESNIQMIRKQSMDSQYLKTEPFNQEISEIQEQILRDASVQLRNWKGLYILCYMKIDLNGYWVGDYGRHGKELIRIYQKGYEVIAQKVTGDENVPAGQTTWKMTLDKNLSKGKGLMQVAEIGYKNAAWVTAYLNIIDRNSLQITWFIYDHYGNWYSLTFGTVRAGVENFNKDVLERKVEMLTFAQSSTSMSIEQ